MNVEMPFAPVVVYVTEEVRRQGHDVSRSDGIQRVSWMLEAWLYALERSEHTNTPTLHDARTLGRHVEFESNRRGFRKVHVRVGMNACPPPDRVRPLLEALWSEIGNHEPMEFYKAFEHVHPFVDGNGRTGKILLNWLNGTLLDPVFPPSNLWGREIQNP